MCCMWSNCTQVYLRVVSSSCPQQLQWFAVTLHSKPRSARYLSRTPRSSQTNTPERRQTGRSVGTILKIESWMDGVCAALIQRQTLTAPWRLTKNNLLYLEAAICSDAQAVAGATEMVRHGCDEAHLTFEAWHFKCLLQDREREILLKMFSSIQSDDKVLDLAMSKICQKTDFSFLLAN